MALLDEQGVRHALVGDLYQRHQVMWDLGIMWDAVTSHRRRNHISRVIVGCIYVGVKVVMVVT
jgi:hypothetical protein